MSWPEFLQYASGPGVAAVVGIVLAELARYWPAFVSFPSKWKRVVFFLDCLSVPLLASLLGVWTCDWPFSWSVTFWPALVAGAVAFGSGTLVHTVRLTDHRAVIADLEARLADRGAIVSRLVGELATAKAAIRLTEEEGKLAEGSG